MPPSEAGPPRVLLLLPNLEYGGAQVAVLGLARELRRLGGRPLVCAWRRGGPLEARARRDGVALELPARERGAWRRLGVARALLAVARRHRSELIHAHLSDCAAWGVWLQGRTGSPCVITHHSTDLIDGSGADRAVYGWARRRLLVACARRARANLAVSEAVRRGLESAACLGDASVRVIPNGVALPAEADVEAARARRGAGAGAGPTVLFAGRLVEGKRLEALIDAVPAVLARHPKARFVLVGDGPRRAALRDRARALGIERGVELPGWVEAPDAWLRQADVVVSPSRIEGQPLGLLEALAWGVPVAASDIPAHRELLGDDERGLLFRGASPGDLARAVLECLADRAAAEARAERGRARARRLHSAEGMARRHASVYESARTAARR